MTDHKEFNLLHHAEDGELLHAEVVKAHNNSWDSGVTLVLPGLDIRNGDTLTLTVKPVRAALPEPLPAEAEART